MQAYDKLKKQLEFIDELEIYYIRRQQIENLINYSHGQ